MTIETGSGKKDFKVAVIGGGMNGLLVTIGLQRAGLEVDLYEAAVSHILPP